MDTENRIAKKEGRLALQKTYINMLRKYNLEDDIIAVFENYAKDLEKSLIFDRKIQLKEVEKSGRKTWRDTVWKYSLVFVGGAIVIKVVEWMLSKF